MGVMKVRTISLAFLALSYFCPYANADESKLKIGFIGSFSGSAQIYGDAARNGFELALDELGRDWVEVIYEDDQFLPAKTVAAFQKLVGADNVDLVITVGSTPSNAVAPLAQSKGVPLVAWASDPKVSRGRSFVIRSYPSGFAEGAAAAYEAEKRNLDKFGVIISTNDYAQSWRGGFVKSVTPFSVVIDEELTGDQQDFKPLLLRARSKGVASYSVCLDPGKSGVFAKQARELNILGPIFGCEYLHDEDEIKTARGALRGAWFPTVPVTDEFRTKYVGKFSNESVISGAAIHYDLAHLLYKATLAGPKKPLVDRIVSSGEHKGAVGDFAVKKMDDDQFFEIPLVIKEVEVG